MVQELEMENVWVPMPYLVLSTAVGLRGQMDKHLFTPFGYVDIRFPGSEGDQPRDGHGYEVTVTGAFDPYRFDDSGLIEFKEYMLNTVREIVEDSLRGLPLGAGRITIRLLPGAQNPGSEVPHPLASDPSDGELPN